MNHHTISFVRTIGRFVPVLFDRDVRPIAARVSTLVAVLFLVLSFLASMAEAQTSVVGSSTSTSSTTEGARKSFFDPSSNTHWVFWYNGTAVEYASSPDGATWTSRGTLAYNTPNFAITHKVLGGTSYVFVVTEANTYDVVIRRGSISGTSVSFDSEETVLDGTSANDAYIRPHVVCDTNGKVWTAAFKDLGNVGDRYHLTARRTTNRGDQALSFNAATSMGKPSASVSSVAMVPMSGDAMLAAVSGDSGTNVVTYEFDGAAWNVRGAGGEYATLSFASAGLSSHVYALALDASGNLYVGGTFTAAAGVTVNGIAQWNGTSWSALGSGVNGNVWELAVDASGNLYAGGSFTTAGGVPANRVAKWDGTSWSALGTGVNSSVYEITFGPGGNVYVAGAFTTAGGITVNRIATWNGSSWSALGTGMNNSVLAMTVDASGNLYAGGRFTTAGGTSIDRIAKWDGAAWSAVGTGMDEAVYALALDRDGNLYAGGYFTTAGGTAANLIAKWDGSAWSALGVGMDVNWVEALAVDADGNVYAGGMFDTAGGVAARSIAKWDGSAWTGLSTSTNSVVSALAVTTSGKLYAGGQFGTIGGITTNYIASWDGTSWSGLDAGLNGTVYAVTSDASGNLYAGGNFTRVGGVAVNHIAKWNGTSWSALGTGVGLLDSVKALAVDAHGNVYAGGWMTSAGGTSVNNIAKWDGTSWSALGAGLDSRVLSLVVDADGNLYAGGDFWNAGGASANKIAKWDGSAWSSLGAGLGGSPNALAFDVSGNLYAGGSFTTAGGVPANRIAKWDGTSWSALGAGINGTGDALAFDSSGNLYVAGTFTTAGGVSANRIAKWNGSSWSALGTGISYPVYSLSVDAGGNLYAGGMFTSAGGTAVNYVARWDGSSWSALGSGVGNYAYALTVDSSGGLFVGGMGGLSLIRPIAVTSQLSGSRASLVAGPAASAHLVYIDTNNDLMMKSYSGSPGAWSAATSIVAGTVSSQATGGYGTNDALVSWFIEGGTVKYTEASSPYTVWSSPTSVSSTGAPTNISVFNSSGTHSQIVATWNRVGASAGEVVSSLSGTSPTPTPTATSTATPTVTQTPTPTATPTLAAPSPPDVDYGNPGDVRHGPNVVVRGRQVILSGTGTLGYSVEIQVDGMVVGTVPITSSNGDGAGTWRYTLPSLAPGERVIATTYVASNFQRSAPSDPVKVVIVAPAPLDFVGAGDTAITSWRRDGDTVRFKSRRASEAEWRTRTIQGHYPAVGDYDDDGVSDIAAVRSQQGALQWNIQPSTSGESMSTSLGGPGDTILAGCNFFSNKGASLAVFKSQRRSVHFKSLGDVAPRSVNLAGLGNCNVIGCGDTDGDGVDELLFATRGADNRIRVVGYDTSGKRRFESRYNSFVRGFVVDRPNSSVPLVAVIGGTERRGRQVKITSMAGSFAFPRFFVERGATIGNGTFTTENNQQVSGIFWANRKNRMVSRRLLARGERSTELFKLPKGYSLVRPQGVVRTEGGR